MKLFVFLCFLGTTTATDSEDVTVECESYHKLVNCPFDNLMHPSFYHARCRQKAAEALVQLFQSNQSATHSDPARKAAEALVQLFQSNQSAIHSDPTRKAAEALVQLGADIKHSAPPASSSSELFSSFPTLIRSKALRPVPPVQVRHSRSRKRVAETRDQAYMQQTHSGRGSRDRSRSPLLRPTPQHEQSSKIATRIDWMEVDLTPNHLANEWWDNEGKQYQELIPGGHPKELSNGCVKNAPIGKNYCESAEETTVYTCEGDTTWNVCLENRGNYYRVRGIGYGRRQLYNTRVYGIEGARALAYLVAEYRSHPDFTQKQLDPKVLNKVVRAKGIRVSHAANTALVRFGNRGAKSLSFLYSAFGKARADILASFAAVLQSKVVFSAIPAQESELRSPDPTQVAKKTNPYLSPMNSSVPTNTRANAVSTPCAWWDNEGKQYQELIPGGHPKELSNGCVKKALIGNNYCESAVETTVYTCEGDTTWNVCLENRENSYRVRGVGYGRCQLYNTRVYGIEGARALAYLTAEYRSHPDFTQKQLDPKVLNKVVRVRGIKVVHAVDRALVRFGNHGAKSVSFLYSAFGKARAEILASFAAVLQSEVVLSASPHCRYSRSPNRNKVV
eukprot:Lankesteria_metandrocarpae@DN5462_c1_g1_i12.p1